MMRILPSRDDEFKVNVEMSPQGDAAEWMVGSSRWRMQRERARWVLYRVGVDVEIREGRFRAMDDAISYSVGWCRGLVSSQHALGAALEATIGEEYVDRESGLPGIPEGGAT
jgi:hypothetical protein